MLPFDNKVRVLTIGSFRDLAELRTAADGCVEPALLLVSPDQIADVAAWLADKDDICLANSPVELIKHRVQRLADSERAKTARLSRDPLTGLLPRQYIVSRLREMKNDTGGYPVSVILCDIDRFKFINDQYGHSAGDEVLCEVARTLQQHAPSCHVGRFGGEEFVLLAACDANSAMEIADSLRKRIAELRFPGYPQMSLTISMGVCTTEVPEDAPDLLGDANQALYAAKANGRDCCVHFSVMQASSADAGSDVAVVGLENQARVLAERVANVITMRSKNLVNSMRKIADIDGLTGCFTRRRLEQGLSDEVRRRDDRPLTVAFLDLDHFGQVNKVHGWATGDKLLRDVCEVIRSSIRQSDWIGRYGGEEFCLVMPNTANSDAFTLLQRLRLCIASHDFRSTTDEPVPMTLSIGAATALDVESGHTELLDRAAKQALLAKNQGRDQVCVAG